jgi:hypothetical protein
MFLCSTPIKWNALLRQVIERCSNGAAISHETPIKSRKAKKTPKLCESCRNRPAFYGFNLRFIHLNALWSHKIAKKSSSIGAKVAFLKVSNTSVPHVRHQKQHVNVQYVHPTTCCKSRYHQNKPTQIY